MKQRYWHFALDDRTLGYGDGRKIVVGETLKVTTPIKMCERGLHASKRIIDALRYAPGAYLCLVELSGIVEHGDDKSVATGRKVIAAADATEMLFRFSVDCAARAVEQSGWTHEASWNALAIRQAHMMGLADDQELSAARNAAWSAAWNAAWNAARSAARSAAWSAARSAAESAARSAAESAARSAAESAARSAARNAAWSAAWSAAESAARSAAWSAAESAARSAAWSAARNAAESAEREIQNAELTRRAYKLLKIK